MGAWTYANNRFCRGAGDICKGSVKTARLWKHGRVRAGVAHELTSLRFSHAVMRSRRSERELLESKISVMGKLRSQSITSRVSITHSARGYPCVDNTCVMAVAQEIAYDVSLFSAELHDVLPVSFTSCELNSLLYNADLLR